MRKLFVASAVALSACSTTPTDIRGHGASRELTSPRMPDAVAACLSRNLESMSGSFRAIQRPLGQAGAVELIGSGSTNPVLVADINPTPSGATAQLWISERWIGFHEATFERLIKGC